jgi:hypothetical protein
MPTLPIPPEASTCSEGSHEVAPPPLHLNLRVTTQASSPPGTRGGRSSRDAALSTQLKRKPPLWGSLKTASSTTNWTEESTRSRKGPPPVDTPLPGIPPKLGGRDCVEPSPPCPARIPHRSTKGGTASPPFGHTLQTFARTWLKTTQAKPRRRRKSPPEREPIHRFERGQNIVHPPPHST